MCEKLVYVTPKKKQPKNIEKRKGHAHLKTLLAFYNPHLLVSGHDCASLREFQWQFQKKNCTCVVEKPFFFVFFSTMKMHFFLRSECNRVQSTSVDAYFCRWSHRHRTSIPFPDLDPLLPLQSLPCGDVSLLPVRNLIKFWFVTFMMPLVSNDGF